MPAKLSDTVNIAILVTKIAAIETTVNEIKNSLERNYVTLEAHNYLQDRLNRMEKLVYGIITVITVPIIGIVLTTFFSLILKTK